MASRKRGLLNRVVDFFWHRPGKRNADTYNGAAINRFTLDWVREPLSADQELRGGRLKLVGRGRDLAKNNAYGRRFVRMSKNHVVGSDGVVLRAVNTMVNGRPLDAINAAVEDAWKRWSRPAFCSTNKRYSWLEIQRLAVSEWKQGGEFLCQMVDDARNPFGFSLHPIDADRLDDSYNVKAGVGQNEIRSGIEIDRIGTFVAFHVLSEHPSEVGMSKPRSAYRERILAENMIFVFERDDRVDRTRGEPPMVAGMRDVRHLDGAQEASVIALRTAAANPIFIETVDPAGEVVAPDEDLYLDGDPGTMTALGLGQKANAPQMTQPRDTFPQLLKAFLRSIASAWGVSYNSMANDLEGVNLSSLRVGRHEEQETWKAEQEMMITQLCQPVFDRWIVSALLKGQIAGAQYDVARVNRIEWHPRRWLSVDPLKDVQTHEKRVALGIDSRSEIVAAEGRDLWETWDHLAEEQEYAAEKGLTIDPPRTTSAGQPVSDDKEDDESSGSTASASDDDAANARSLRVVRSR